jgi:hypothetical protein
LVLDFDLLRKGELGAIYVTEGANRLSRDPDRVVSAMLLKLMKESNCKLRTPYEVLSPRIERDWDIIHAELEKGAEEHKGMYRRLHHRKALKAARGEFVGEPIPPGFILPIKSRKVNGQYEYGKMQPYLPHAAVDTQILREYIKQRGSKLKTAQALADVTFPFFPPELAYMARLSALRSCPKTPAGYRITPAVVMGLARNLKLIGVWQWGDGDSIIKNHEPAVPEDLFMMAYELAIASGKPKGRAVNHEPMDWSGLLWCFNHDEPTQVASNSSAGAYRCQRDYAAGVGRICLNIERRFIDEPLTTEVLRQVDFTPVAEELLAQLESEAMKGKLEATQRSREVADLERRLENLKQYLGCGDREREEVYWQQFKATDQRLQELRGKPTPERTIAAADIGMVKQFLTELPHKWQSYSATMRNKLMKLLIDRVELRHGGKSIEATIFWKTGFNQCITIQRARATDNRGSNWTDEEENLLKVLWRNASQEVLQGALPNRTWSAILNHAQYLRLKREKTPGYAKLRCRWTAEEESQARALYEAGTPLPEMVTRLHRSRSSILQRAMGGGWHRPAWAKWRKEPVMWKADQNLKVFKEESSPVVK